MSSEFELWKETITIESDLCGLVKVNIPNVTTLRDLFGKISAITGMFRGTIEVRFDDYNVYQREHKYINLGSPRQEYEALTLLVDLNLRNMSRIGVHMPIHMAAIGGNIEALGLWIKSGVPINSVNSRNETALRLAILIGKNQKAVDFLKLHGAKE